MTWIAPAIGFVTVGVCTFTSVQQLRILRELERHKRAHEALAGFGDEHVKVHEQLHAAAHQHVTTQGRTLRA